MAAGAALGRGRNLVEMLPLKFSYEEVRHVRLLWFSPLEWFECVLVSHLLSIYEGDATGNHSIPVMRHL